MKNPPMAAYQIALLTREEAQHKIAELLDELEPLRESVKQLTAGPDKVLRCAFCGEPYPEGTPTHKSETLAAHIRVCTEHPIGKENRILRAALAPFAKMGELRSGLPFHGQQQVWQELPAGAPNGTGFQVFTSDLYRATDAFNLTASPAPETPGSTASPARVPDAPAPAKLPPEPPLFEQRV